MMDATCIWQRPTVGRDAAQGVTSDPWVTLGTNITCSYQENGASTKTDLYGQRITQVTPKVYFPTRPTGTGSDGKPTEPDVNDRLIVTQRWGQGQVITALVEGNAESDTHGLLWEVPVRRIRAAT